MVRQIVRGCGNLPHVGPHPGTGIFVGIVGLAALSGLSGHGLPGALIGGGMMFVGMGFIYFGGAYSRAKLSDRMGAS